MSRLLEYADGYQDGEASTESRGLPRIEVEREMGTWTLRINGVFVFDAWREAKVRRVAMSIRKALGRP